MKLTKNKVMSIAVVLIMLAIYNIVVFVIPFSRGGGFWSSYASSMLALLLTAAVIFYAFDREGLRSKFYGVPLISVAWRYLIVQMIVGFAQIILDLIPIPFQYGLAVDAILLGACLIGLIAVDMSKEEIERIDEKVKEKVFYIKSLQADVEGIADKASDESVKKAMKDLAETIRYSDPMSSPQLAAIENKIESKVAILSETADADSVKTLCIELQQLLAERNRKCKTMK